MKFFKQCSCGKAWLSPPEKYTDTRLDKDTLAKGIFFNCDCHSTLFVEESQIEDDQPERQAV